MRITVQKAIENVQADMAVAREMMDKLEDHPARKRGEACEQLHYWDGKWTGLGLALRYMQNIGV